MGGNRRSRAICSVSRDPERMDVRWVFPLPSDLLEKVGENVDLIASPMARGEGTGRLHALFAHLSLLRQGFEQHP